MKLKKQLNLLATFITAIPIACIIFICISYYFRSSKRYLIKGYEEVRMLDTSNLTPKDYKLFMNNLRLLPSNVETALIDSMTGQVILSTIHELPVNSFVPQWELWAIMEGNSTKYFYQFTTLHTLTLDSIMITRVPRKKNNVMKNQQFIFLLYSILFVIVSVCIYILIALSRNINNSIKKIEKETQELANGNLNIKINSNSNKSNEITSISESLEQMRVSLVEAQNQKTKFIMGISHDLRTPVAIIKGYSEAISDGVISDENEIKSTMELITSKTNQLETMIDTLINFTKMNSTEIRESMKVQSITDFINEVITEEKSAGNVFNRKIITKVDFDRNIQIPFDKQLITRVFENLFNNALRYTKNDDTITISSYIENSNIIYKISDTGIGIEKEDLKNIFELFYRGTNSRLEEGMGIGLSVVKNIIETHRWKIDVESQKNIGTTFTITIPF